MLQEIDTRIFITILKVKCLFDLLQAGEAAIHVAARYGHTNVIEYLCNVEANVNLQDKVCTGDIWVKWHYGCTCELWVKWHYGYTCELWVKWHYRYTCELWVAWHYGCTQEMWVKWHVCICDLWVKWHLGCMDKLSIKWNRIDVYSGILGKMLFTDILRVKYQISVICG